MSRSPLTPVALRGSQPGLWRDTGRANFPESHVAIDRQQQLARFGHNEGVDGAQDRATNGLPSSRIACPLAR